MKNTNWIVYATLTTVSWGVWGALIELPEKAGFPATLGYCAWAVTMTPCALYAARNTGWRIKTNKRSIAYGMAVGLLGAGGQLILFKALESGPAYIVFPLISLSPAITILFSMLFLKERATQRQWFGILFSLIAIFMLSYQPPTENTGNEAGWLISATLVFLMWGAQGYYLKTANSTTDAESIFFYMTIAGLLLTPFALYITDFSQEINWSQDGAYAALLIQLLNSFGALMLVYAYRFGKAIVVSPLTALSPIVTVTLSLLIYSVVPGAIALSGILIAVTAIFLMT